jgi:hypothetical protein
VHAHAGKRAREGASTPSLLAPTNAGEQGGAAASLSLSLAQEVEDGERKGGPRLVVVRDRGEARGGEKRNG